MPIWPRLLAIALVGSAVAAHAAEPRYRIAYGTCLGGPAWEQAREVIVLSDGSILVGMQAASANLPTSAGAFQRHYAGDDPNLGHSGVYGGDCYLARFSPAGAITAATYLGGSKQERNVYGMALDRQGNIVIAAATRSPDAPTTPGAFQRVFAGGPSDMLVAKLTGDLTRLLWCTYVGGSGDDFPRGGLALDDHDNVLVVGTSNSPNFPTTAGVIQTRLNGPRDSAIVKLKADGSALLFSTLLGGSGEDDAIMGIQFDAAGNLYIAGHTRSADFPVTGDAAQPRLGGQSDCYLAKLTPDASRLIYATYLGGSGNEFAEHRPLLMPDGSLVLAGFADSSDFPTTAGAFQRRRGGPGDGFLARLAPDGRRFIFATLLGGSGGENWLMPTLDAQGNIWIAGSTSSRDFPVTADAFQGTYGGGPNDGALAVLSPDGSALLYASYLGGSGDEMIRSLAFGPDGQVYLVGNTSSPDFPVTADAVQPRHAGQGDAFVVKLVPAGRVRR